MKRSPNKVVRRPAMQPHCMLVGHIGRLVVRRDRQPARALPAKRDASQKLQVGYRVRVEGAVQPAVDQQRLLIRGQGNAVRRSGRSVAVLLLGGYFGKLDLVDLRLRCEIHDLKPIQATQLSEYPLGGAVGIFRNRHRGGRRSHLKLPGEVVGLRVNHVHHVRRRLGASARPGNDVLAVRGDVQVMDAAFDRDGLEFLKRDGVDHVDAAARIGLDLRKLRQVVIRKGDRHIDPSPIRGDIDKVGVPAQRNLLGHLKGLAIDDGERLVRFLADVDSAAVGGDRDPVARFDSLDLSHHLVRGGVDDVDVIPGGVRLDDPQLRFLRGQEGERHRAQSDPGQSRETATKRLLVRHLRHPLFRDKSFSWRHPSGDRSVHRETSRLPAATSPSLPG